VKIAPAGDRGILVEFGDVSAAELHAAAAAMRARADVRACIVGHESLYVIFDSDRSAAACCRSGLRQLAAAVRAPAGQQAAGSTESSGSELPHSLHRIVVSFREEYGPDLPQLGVPHDEFFSSVRELRLVVRYIGFRGGFGYLDGWPREWSMPRRPTSRPRVAAGTFAVAGHIAGFYPLDSPGGWNLLGRTDQPLMHVLAPGDQIEIEPTMDVMQPVRAPFRSTASPFPLRLIQSPLTTLAGAEDWSGIERGIPPGGPFDDVAAACANVAVGNEEDAPILECALTGPRAIAEESLVLSWFGASAEVRVGGKFVPDPRQFEVRQGDEVTIGRLTGGARGYLAAGRVRGRIRMLDRDDRLTIRAIAGPHETSLRELVCEVTPQLDRVGIRMRTLTPAGIAVPANLPSCGMQRGTLQLHPDGSVVAMGPDHPVTGGYLQPMTVMWSERWKLGQLTPGERVRFVAHSLSP
jgi:allophanate hydrolase subunit 1